MNSFTVDVSELVALADDLGVAGVTSHVAAIALVGTLAQRGAQDARQRVQGQIRPKYLPHYANSITSESHGLRAEYGPDSGHPQGGMGAGVEYGSVNTGPRPHVMPSADRIEKELDQQFARLVAKVLW